MNDQRILAIQQNQVAHKVFRGRKIIFYKQNTLQMQFSSF